MTQASYRALNPETPTPSGALRSDSFQYDALGNRYGAAHVASRGPMNFTRRDNGLNQYLMWSPFSALYYDDSWGTPPAPFPEAPWVPPGNGVTMADGWITASYNALNQPVAMGSQGLGSNFYWFWHDPLGRCVKRWLGDGNRNPVGPVSYFYYDGWNVVQEGPNASTADRIYVHGGRVDEIVASQVGGQWYNHHYDARGHCILLTTASGGLEQQYDYDAFGFPYFYTATGAKLNTSLVKTRFLFTGREWLSDLRLYDYRHRHYQPELGRFLQPDPIQFKAEDYNLYRYCHNDPINKTDPLGLFESPAWMQATIPGQVEWDAAVTNFQAGNYGTAAALTGAMIGQQIMAVYSMGASSRVNTTMQTARTAFATTQAATQTSRIALKEGNMFLAVVTKEGKVAGTASAGSSHAALVQKLFGAGGLPKGATAVTVGKMDGKIVVQNSRTFSGNQLPAPKPVLEAIVKNYE